MKIPSKAVYLLWVNILLNSLSPYFLIIGLSHAVTLLLLAFNGCSLLYLCNKGNKGIRPLAMFILLMCASSFVSWYMSPKQVMGINGVYNTSHIMTGTITNLTIICFVYLLSIQNKITKKQLIKFGWIYIAICLINFFYNRATTEYSSFGNGNNAGYGFLYAILLILMSGFTKKNQIVLYVVCFFVIFSAKRGAIGALSVILLFFVYFKYLKRGIKSWLIMPFFVGIVTYTANYVFTTDENLQNKISATQDGDTSGREAINEALLYKFYSCDTKEKIWGSQFCGSIALLEMDAHNDWLEVLTGQGLVGVSLYALILLSMLILTFKRLKYMEEHEKFIILAGFFGCMLLKSFISQMLYNEETKVLMIVFAYVIGQTYLREQRYEDVSCRNI